MKKIRVEKEIDCGEEYCRGCDYLDFDVLPQKHGCNMFMFVISEDKRCQQCLDAEIKGGE